MGFNSGFKGLTDFPSRDVKYLSKAEAFRNAVCDVGTEFAYIIYMDLRLQMVRYRRRDCF